ncbi:MAG: ribosome recycling factor [Oligoflexia bacterium]|nr:ribosome recycling factor [Oligoflexia bacterium]
MTADVIQKMKALMEKSVENTKAELSKLRTGRASTAILDGIKIDYYGNPTVLSQVATLSAPEARLIVIQPWEVSILKEIETAIQKSDIGLNPMNDGKVIRLKVPDLTEERRKDLVKVAKKIAEEGRVSVRLHRREANDKIKDLLKDKKITEDENKKTSDQIQKLTDEYIGKIDTVANAKEKDILTI